MLGARMLMAASRNRYRDYGLEVLASGPVAYWKFDEQLGAVTANDSTGNGHVGEYHGGTLEGEGLISEGSAVFLDGSLLDYISVPHDSAFNSDSQSIELWVKAPLPVESTKGLAYKAPDTGFDREFSLDLHSSGTFRFSVYDGSSQTAFIDTQETWLDGEIHHVVGVKEYTSGGDKLSIFVDGELRGDLQATFHGVQNSNEIVFGKVSSLSSTDRYLTGYLDGGAIYNRPLPPTEILRHYLAGKS